MKKSAHIADGQVGERSDYFLTSLVDFCVDSVNTCLSRDADTLCVPVGLTFLSALLLLLSCLLFVYQRCKIRGENPGETAVFFYCFIGNLCSTTGAILSRQLHIQILMGAFAAAVDFVNCILWCFPVFLCWNSKAEKRLRMMKRRRRQHLLAVCVLMVVAGGFLKSRVSHTSALQPVKGRTLLHVVLQVSSWSSSMDNTEIVGYLLGLLSFVIACTSRIPKLCRVCNGHKVTHTAIFSGLLCSLAGALYTAAILLCDTQFRFLMRAMPWLLSSAGCVTLDLLIVITHWCKRGSSKKAMRLFADTERLLGGSRRPAKNNTAMKRQTKEQIPSSAQTKIKNLQKMREVGQYMDVNSQPARKKVTSPRGDVGSEPPSRRVGAIRADGFCSTDTSCDSSPVSSDLEWDFEAANTHWSKATAKQQEGDEFPLQEWPTNPEPFNICARSPSGLAQKALSGTEECGSVVSLAK
ncbi:transmembrane protein 44 isoform X1 [Maylandia zebra]|uniref:Transmembrane protein 44 n=1 Tax=Astatotilapia calliptera TaxID=8154 RepID=A0A3P8N7G2_ASTCA|nr:transmembrane protein 44 isoform X1 [Maylandia zebra]XP_025998293.1 transmembrane protein 44 isoform X1 [Astatotilapia calliptera]XP_042078480.1 transmembrane protein 44 isoform X1 [Haplochromis burtoni]